MLTPTHSLDNMIIFNSEPEFVDMVKLVSRLRKPCNGATNSINCGVLCSEYFVSE